jgi:E3 SUMO-protein ligase RanBP2
VPDFLTKTSSIGGFAEIAAGASPNNKPFSGATAATSGFFGLTVKDDFFSKNLNKQNTSGADGEANDSETVHEDNYDPHYDPIISLPDEIQVSTGEEDEEKLFGERAKLYRYDVKLREWKERGKF